MKVLFLYIKINKKRNKKKTTKDTLVKEYNKKINKLMESEKTWRTGKKEYKLLRLCNQKKEDKILRK